MNSYFLFLLIVTAVIVIYLAMESGKTHSKALLRIMNYKYRLVIDLLTEARNIQDTGLDENKTKEQLKNRYKNKSLSFMRITYPSPKYKDAIDFIGKIINNDSQLSLLLKYGTKPSFNKKLFKQLCKDVESSDNCNIAKTKLMDILEDTSAESINNAMIWLPRLMSEPFIKDSKNGQSPCMTENAFSVLFYLRQGENNYIKQSVSADKFLQCLKELKKLNPKMKFPTGRSNESDYMSGLTVRDERRDKILNEIKKITEKQ